MSVPRIVTLDEIRSVLPGLDLLDAMDFAFRAYSRGDCVIPPVGELLIDEDPHGEVHIKHGYARGGRHYVVKIASGFPENAGSGLPSGNGLMLLFDLRTGALRAILLDEGHLTDARTAAAGALASRTLAPTVVESIGILGTGVQARLQLESNAHALGCARALVWGRDPSRARALAEGFEGTGIRVEPVDDPGRLLVECRVIVTCTASTEALIKSGSLMPGTHITAVGSDTPEKQELDAGVLGSADLVVVDSLEQGRLRGEVAQALRSGAVRESDVIELGAVLDGRERGRTSDDQLTVADLTGVAIQDLAIAEAVHDAL